MYYILIVWFERVKKVSKGYVEIINYADDMVVCFQYKNEAIKIYKLMKECIGKSQNAGYLFLQSNYPELVNYVERSRLNRLDSALFTVIR